MTKDSALSPPAQVPASALGKEGHWAQGKRCFPQRCLHLETCANGKIYAFALNELCLVTEVQVLPGRLSAAGPERELLAASRRGAYPSSLGAVSPSLHPGLRALLLQSLRPKPVRKRGDHGAEGLAPPCCEA